MADVPGISQGPTAAPLPPLAPVADPGAVDAFNAAMDAAPAPGASSWMTKSLSFNVDGSLAPATDEQLATLGPSELSALQRKFGSDDLGLRKEAAAILALKDQMGNSLMMAMMRDMQKRIADSKE